MEVGLKPEVGPEMPGVASRTRRMLGDFPLASKSEYVIRIF